MTRADHTADMRTLVVNALPHIGFALLHPEALHATKETLRHVLVRVSGGSSRFATVTACDGRRLAQVRWESRLPTHAGLLFLASRDGRWVADKPSENVSYPDVEPFFAVRGYSGAGVAKPDMVNALKAVLCDWRALALEGKREARKRLEAITGDTVDDALRRGDINADVSAWNDTPWFRLSTPSQSDGTMAFIRAECHGQATKEHLLPLGQVTNNAAPLCVRLDSRYLQDAVAHMPRVRKIELYWKGETDPVVLMAGDHEPWIRHVVMPVRIKGGGKQP